MMKTTLRDLTRSAGALQAAAKSEKRTALASLTLGLLLRAMDPYLRQYQIERARLLEQYGTLADAARDLWQFPDPARRKAFNRENDTLLDLEVELAGVSPVPASKWAANGINWDAEQLLVLEWLVPLDVPTLFVVQAEAEPPDTAAHASPAAA